MISYKHHFNGQAVLNGGNKQYYKKCKEEARDLLYEEMETRALAIFDAWPTHFGFIEIAVQDFNTDYKPHGFSIDHDPLYRRSIEFNNIDIGNFSLHIESEADGFDLRFSPENYDIKPMWLKIEDKDKARFVSKAVLRFLMSEDNDKNDIPALINDYPDFVNYIFGIYGRD